MQTLTYTSPILLALQILHSLGHKASKVRIENLSDDLTQVTFNANYKDAIFYIAYDQTQITNPQPNPIRLAYKRTKQGHLSLLLSDFEDLKTTLKSFLKEE